MLAAQLLDPAAADDAVGVADEDHREEHRRRIRRGAGGVVAEARVEGGEIECVLEQVMDRVLERAGQQLLRQVDGY